MKGLESTVVLDTEVVLQLFSRLGPEEVAMYVLIHAAEQPVNADQLAAWSHLPKERVLDICNRLGRHELGLTVDRD